MLESFYERIVDEESREIFKSRLLYSLTGDFNDVRKLIETTSAAKEIRRRVTQHSDRDVVIWGTGFWGSAIIEAFPDINWKCYVDNTPKVTVKNQLPVYSANKFFENYNNELILIATTFYEKSIYQQLLSEQISDANIINAGELMNQLFDQQYFDLPYMPRSDDEIFLDVGCFDGLTVRNFVHWSRNAYKEIIAFEPDICCYEKCKKELKDIRNLTLINKGAWSKEAVLQFDATGVSDSKISESGTTRIETCRLDDIVGDKCVTFLKMDIEGAEKEALIGAERIIREQKPKLAISIYHKKEDIWEIPQLLMKWNPNYRFYLRHYSLRFAETVLYAV